MINKFRNLFKVHLHFSKKSAWVLLALLVAFTLIFEKASALEYEDFDETTQIFLNELKNDDSGKYNDLKTAVVFGDFARTIGNGDFGDLVVNVAHYVSDADDYTSKLLNDTGSSVPVSTLSINSVDTFGISYSRGRFLRNGVNIYDVQSSNTFSGDRGSTHYMNAVSVSPHSWDPADRQIIYGVDYLLSDNTYYFDLKTSLVTFYDGFDWYYTGSGCNTSVTVNTSGSGTLYISVNNFIVTYSGTSYSSSFEIPVEDGDHSFTFNISKTADRDNIHYDQPTYLVNIDGSFNVSTSNSSSAPNIRPIIPDLSQFKPNINNYGDLNQASNMQRWNEDNRIYNDVVNYINDKEREIDLKESIAGVDKHDGIYELNENTSIISYPSEFFSAFCLSLSENYQSWFSFDIEEVKWNDIVLFPESHIVIRPETFIPSDLVDVFRYIILFMLVIPWILYLFRTIRGSEVLEDD